MCLCVHACVSVRACVCIYCEYQCKFLLIFVCLLPLSLVNARLALCLASDGVLSLPIRVTMVALLSNSFCQTNAGNQETDFQLHF